VAGVVLTLVGGFRLTFAVACALSTLPLLIVALKVREPVDPPVDPPVDLPVEPPVEGPPATTGLTDDLPPTRPSDRSPVVPFAMVGFLITGSAYLFTALFPVFATEYAGLSPASVGFIYVIGSLMALTGPLWGWLADRTSFGLVLSLRSVANVASSILYLVAPNLAGVAAGKALDDTGKAAFRPAWGAMMAHAAAHDRPHRARIMAWLGVGEDAGEVAGPILAGLVWTAWGIPALLGIRIAAAVAAEVATGLVTHRYRSVAPKPAATSRRGDKVEPSMDAIGDGPAAAAVSRTALGVGPPVPRGQLSIAGGLGLDGPGDPDGDETNQRSLVARVDVLTRRTQELADLVTANQRTIDHDRAAVQASAERMMEALYRRDQEVDARAAAHRRAREAEVASRMEADAEVQQEAQRQSFERMMALRERDLQDRAVAHERAHQQQQAGLADLRERVTRLVDEALPAVVADVRAATDLQHAEYEEARRATERLWAETEAVADELRTAVTEMRAALAHNGALARHAAAYQQALEELRSALGRPTVLANGRSGPEPSVVPADSRGRAPSSEASASASRSRRGQHRRRRADGDGGRRRTGDG